MPSIFALEEGPSNSAAYWNSMGKVILGVGKTISLLFIFWLFITSWFFFDYYFLTNIFPSRLFCRFGFITLLLDDLIKLGLLGSSSNDLGRWVVNFPFFSCLYDKIFTLLTDRWSMKIERKKLYLSGMEIWDSFLFLR